MLTIDQIQRQYPKHLRQFKRHLLREYLQSKILESCYRSAWSNQLVFLGGTAARLLYNNQRFSEDLDFDNLGLSEADFAQLAEQIVQDLGYEGIKVETKLSYKAAYHCYCKFPRLLYEQGLTPQKREKIMVRIDAVSQGFEYQPLIKPYNRFDVFVQLKTVSPELLLAQKIVAALGRKTTKGRDFFDIVFLMGQQIEPDYRYLAQKRRLGTRTQLKQALLTRATEVDLPALAVDVLPFLMKPTDIDRVTQFKEFMAEW